MTVDWAGTRARQPRSGEVLYVTREASVQFASPILFRVIRVHAWPTYTGWVWLDGYQLDSAGNAMARRDIFVQPDGLRWVSDPVRRPRNTRTRASASADATLPHRQGRTRDPATRRR